MLQIYWSTEESRNSLICKCILGFLLYLNMMRKKTQAKNNLISAKNNALHKCL